MIRRATGIVGVLWLATVGWYWSRELPLRPQAVIECETGQFFEGLSPNGELMISKTSGQKTANGLLIRYGPLECRDPFEADKKRILFEPGDTITPGSHDPDGRTIVIREGVARLANVVTGDVGEPLPDFPTTPVVSYWFKGDRVVCTNDGDFIVYDLSTKRILRSLKGGPQLEWVVKSTTDRYVAVWANQRGTSPSPNRDNRIVDVVTGEVDTRFAALPKVDTITLSPDDRYAVLNRAGSFAVHERESAKELWSVGNPLSNYGVRFEEEGRILALDGLDAQYQLQVARWRLADGIVLSPMAPKQEGRGWRDVMTGTPYAIDSVITIKPNWEQTLTQVRIELDLWFSGTRGTRTDERHRNTLVDTRTGTSVGLLPAEWISGIALPGGRGLMVWSDNPPARETARFYSPPQKDWGWLIRWAVIPAGLILACSRLLGRRRMADQLHEVPK